MRASITLVVIGAACAAAQGLSSLPACGQTCIQNMLAIAPSLGCASGDVTCYCTQPDFGYGIRDCSIESCPTQADADAVISFGIAYCKKALAGASGSSVPSGASASNPGSSGASESAGPTASGSSSGAAGGGRRVPVTTSTLSGVETVGGETVTTATGTTTLFGVVSGLKTTETMGGETITTVTGMTTLTGAKASAATATGKGGSTKSGGTGSGSQTTGGGSGGGRNSGQSSTSTGLAPIVTAVPGLIGAVVIAALAL